jgi:hypothetical protein
MSLNSDDGYEPPECPLCTEILEPDDLNFKPCPCGYQICIWCWHKLNEKDTERCPNCRRPYDQQQLNFIAPSDGQDKKGDKKGKKRNIKVTSRKQLTNVRVIQRNLVYVVGLTLEVAKEDFLRRNDNFSKYGKIAKVVINKSNLQTATKSPDTTRAPTVSAYITYAKPEDAGSCIQAIDGTWLDGKLLRASFGTTKYCSYFLRGVECANPDCMYLHDYAAEDDTYNKEDIVLKNGLPVPSKIEKLEEYYPNKSPAEKHIWNFISTQPNEEDSDDYYSEEEDQEEYEEDEEEQEQDKKVPEARPKKIVFQSNSLPSTAQWGSNTTQPVQPTQNEWKIENKEEKTTTTQPIQLNFPDTSQSQPLDIPTKISTQSFNNEQQAYPNSFDSFGDSETSSLEDFEFQMFNSNRKQSRFQFAQSSFGFHQQQQQQQQSFIPLNIQNRVQNDFQSLLPNVNVNVNFNFDEEETHNQFSFEDFQTTNQTQNNFNNTNGGSSKLLSLLKKQPETNGNKPDAKRSLFQDSAIIDFGDSYQFNGLY